MWTLLKELLQRNQNVKNYSELLIKRYGYNWGNIEKRFTDALYALISQSVDMSNHNKVDLPELSSEKWKNILNCYNELYNEGPKNVNKYNLYNSSLEYFNYKAYITNNMNNRSKNNRSKHTINKNIMRKRLKQFKKTLTNNKVIHNN